MGIVHRDLKQDNILCSVVQGSDGVKKYLAKIADFGLSAVIGINTYQDSAKMNKQMKSFHKLNDMWGTREYFAPEVYKKAYGPQVDVWSLGCVLYELLTGVSAFPVREIATSLVERIVLNNGKKVRRAYQLAPQWAELSIEAQDLLSNMLKINPKKRYSIQECLDHPFIQRVLPEDNLRTTYVDLNASTKVKDDCVSESVSVAGNKMGDRSRSRILTSARSSAVKGAELKSRRLKILAEQIEKELAADH
jgi:serine/threonine protein kinase